MNKKEPASKAYMDLTERDWQLSRKAFLRMLLLSGAATQLPWLQACSSPEENFGDTSPLSLEQFKTVRTVQNILFPDDGNGPGAYAIHADTYLCWVLRDPLPDPDEARYIIKRIDQFIDACKEEHQCLFTELSSTQQEAFVKSIAEKDWGERWFSRLLTLIFEALLLDPVYGGNTDESGWKWLDHDPGRPRPEKRLLYPEILKNHAV